MEQRLSLVVGGQMVDATQDEPVLSRGKSRGGGAYQLAALIGQRNRRVVSMAKGVRLLAKVRRTRSKMPSDIFARRISRTG